MYSRIVVFNRFGFPIGEFAANTKRSWVLNNFGECTFVVSRKDKNLKRELLEYGNIILVTNINTKPWAGVIDTPRTWTKHGPRVTAYSGEILFNQRDGLRVDMTTNLLSQQTKLTGPAGAIFKQLIDMTNGVEKTVLQAGDIYGGGVNREETLSTDYLTHVRNVSYRSGNDFEVVPSIGSTGLITLKANWMAKKQTLRNVVFEEGVNIDLKDEIITEQGVIRNSIVGGGVAEIDTPSIGASYNVDASVSKFGKRQASIIYGDISDLSTLAENVRNYALQNAYPRTVANVTCVDKDFYKLFNEGDMARLKLYRSGFLENGQIGFNAKVRILGILADDEKGTMDVALEEFTGVN